jgi:phosphoheptose isomerase
VGRFAFDRPPLPAIALTTDTSILTAVSNDYSYIDIFSRQILALGNLGDILICISTSGTSDNIIKAAESAKNMGIKVILLIGSNTCSLS